MALARIEITCTHCGKTFENRKVCYNRQEANNYEDWARKNVTLCPKCHAAQWIAEQEAKLPALPAIEGVSDKQIAFAANLRAKYIINNPAEVKAYQTITRTLTAEEQADLEVACKANGIDPADAIRVMVEEMGLQEVEIALTETSARKLIDTLK